MFDMLLQVLKQDALVFAAADTTARLPDISRAGFLRLVEARHRPDPVVIDMRRRWNMTDL